MLFDNLEIIIQITITIVINIRKWTAKMWPPFTFSERTEGHLCCNTATSSSGAWSHSWRIILCNCKNMRWSFEGCASSRIVIMILARFTTIQISSIAIPYPSCTWIFSSIKICEDQTVFVRLYTIANISCNILQVQLIFLLLVGAPRHTLWDDIAFW